MRRFPTVGPLVPRIRRGAVLLAIAFFVALMGAGATGAAAVDEATPRHGGTLVYIVSAEPPSFDAHRETTFATLHPIRPHYDLLVKFDLAHYPRIVGDLAESWTISEDGLTYTFHLRRDVVWHDDDPFTSRDVKAT